MIFADKPGSDVMKTKGEMLLEVDVGSDFKGQWIVTTLAPMTTASKSALFLKPLPPPIQTEQPTVEEEEEDEKG